eukprot:1468960-Karenia_brevis.AAC.1
MAPLAEVSKMLEKLWTGEFDPDDKSPISGVFTSNSSSSASHIASQATHLVDTSVEADGLSSDDETSSDESTVNPDWM